ncbi:MAG: type IV toxin-antitoxin system AbiEi family antitoxin domain-containing protein, partial [Nitrospirae bacterium]|nr:type IV toxin-antitoxin system AbiEi family antitoxin domain-containing protein [Nitrospirota bacterium]
MKPQDFFDNHPVFTYEEFASSVESKSNRTRDALLTYYVKKGRLLNVRRGLYAVVSSGTSPDKSPVDLDLIASKLTSDAVLAYHTALELHGKAYSVRKNITYLTGQRSRPLNFQECIFKAVSFPKALRKKHLKNFGVTKIDRAGIDILVTGYERILVDVLDRPDLAGGWEEIWRSLESIEFFDLDRVVEYALLLDNSTTAAKVGFYLEQHRETLMVSKNHLDKLQSIRPRMPHYMVR